jgi:hypothetical protein
MEDISRLLIQNNINGSSNKDNSKDDKGNISIIYYSDSDSDSEN